MKAGDVKRLKALEVKNARLKRIVADQTPVGRGVAKDEPGKVVSPQRRRQAVRMVGDRLVMSERACGSVSVSRSTQRQQAIVADDDRALRARLRAISRKHRLRCRD